MESFEKLNYDPNTGVLTWRVSPGKRAKAGSIAGTSNGKGYLKISYEGKQFFVHRVAWFITYGRWPSGEIDHVNGNRSDNRLTNLRDVTRSVNNQNQRRAQANNKSSGKLGVSLHKETGKWQSRISINGKQTHIGLFNTQEAAQESYLAAKRLHHEGNTL